MKEKLTLEKALELNLKWHDCIRYYKPDATDDECEFILWEQTCFPFDHETTLNQIYGLFKFYSPENKESNPRVEE